MQLNYFSINPIQKKMSMCKMKKKALAFSLAMSVALPIGAFAQDGLFQRGVSDGTHYGIGSVMNREGGLEWKNGGMTPQDPTQPVPLGSGLTILALAGACYTIVKSNNRMEEL